MRSIVLTGVSRGLGAALFDELYGQGHRILALGRRFSAAQQATDPARVRLRVADLSDPLSQPDAAELTEFLGGGPAALVLNAAVVTPIGPVGRLRSADLAATVAVNLTAPMVLCNEFLAAVPDGRRDIVFISSGAARQVISGWPGYCTTKAGAEMFFAVLATQYVDDPLVRVATVDPGQMATGMQADIRASTFPARQRWVDSHQQGRLQDTAAVARRIIAEHLTDE